MLIQAGTGLVRQHQTARLLRRHTPVVVVEIRALVAEAEGRLDVEPLLAPAKTVVGV